MVTLERAWSPPSREKILESLRAADRPMTPDALAQRLGVLEPEHRQILERRLAAMERDGQLLPNRKGVLLLASKLDFIAGKVIGHRDGFGFVRRDEGGPDLFLPPPQMDKVMHGDRVLVKLAGVDGRGREEAAIVEVTERANRLLVGRFLNERGVAIVVPEDNRIKHDILIAPGHTGEARHGQIVTCEVIEPPTRQLQPIGQIREVLGDLGDPGMEIEIAVRKFDVPHEFDPAATVQAEALPEELEAPDFDGRVDLRDVPFVTIDGADARDFDDAVYCEPSLTSGKRPRRNGYRLLVAIADVSHYVRPGSALEVAAAERTTSVYFPRRVIPMLPEKLSNGLCSLNPACDRLTMVCDMVINEQGKVRAYQFYEAVIHSAARVTYDEAWGLLSGRRSDEPLPVTPRLLDDGQLEQRLVALGEVYRLLLAARGERGALEFDSIETRIESDPAGRITRIVPVVRNEAHRIIEEAMLAANVCAADLLRRHKHDCLYRVHEGPTAEKLTRLREFLKSTNLSLGGGDSPQPSDFAELTRRIANRPDTLLLQTMILRSMQQAIYSPDNVGHFGLAYAAYTHFTSPIRRYADLLVHRSIKALLRGGRYEPAPQPSEPAEEPATPAPRRKRPSGGDAASRERAARVHARWQAVGAVCSANERRADDASRDVQAWLKAQYMRDRVGDEYRGRITGVAPFGVFVTLDSLYVEGMVHVSELGSEYFRYNEAGHELRGERTGLRFRLTDPIDVQVARVDLEARRIEFRLVAGEAPAERGGADSTARKKTRKAAPAPDAKVREARAARKKGRARPVKGASSKAGAASPRGPRRGRRG
ncbi:MAG: ribonuclease R [Burkholderiaceae bacterium]